MPFALAPILLSFGNQVQTKKHMNLIGHYDAAVYLISSGTGTDKEIFINVLLSAMSPLLD